MANQQSQNKGGSPCPMRKTKRIVAVSAGDEKHGKKLRNAVNRALDVFQIFKVRL